MRKWRSYTWTICDLLLMLSWNIRTHSAVVKSCHAHTRFIESVLLQWYRMACKCLQIIIFYESINITKNALVFPSIWRYLVKILNRICMWSCGEGCRSQLSDSRRLASWTGVSKSIIAFCVFSPLKELVFVSTESLIGLWCLLLIGCCN